MNTKDEAEVIRQKEPFFMDTTNIGQSSLEWQSNIYVESEVCGIVKEQILTSTDLDGAEKDLQLRNSNNVKHIEIPKTSENDGNHPPPLSVPTIEEDTTVEDSPGVTTKIVKTKSRRVSFPESDSDLVTGYLEPANPWAEVVPVKSPLELLDLYEKSCEKHKSKPIEIVRKHLESIVLDSARMPLLNLKTYILEANNCEPLEELFKRVQYNTIDLTSCDLDDIAATALFDMIEYYEATNELNISLNPRIGDRGWQSCSNMLKRSQQLTNLTACGIPLSHTSAISLGRAVSVSSLHTLKLEHCGVCGNTLTKLCNDLQNNKILKELWLAHNDLSGNDAIQIGKLLMKNHYLQLLDVSNNRLEDIGVEHIVEALIVQTKCLKQLENERLAQIPEKTMSAIYEKSSSSTTIISTSIVQQVSAAPTTSNDNKTISEQTIRTESTATELTAASTDLNSSINICFQSGTPSTGRSMLGSLLENQKIVANSNNLKNSVVELDTEIVSLNLIEPLIKVNLSVEQISCNEKSKIEEQIEQAVPALEVFNTSRDHSGAGPNLELPNVPELLANTNIIEPVSDIEQAKENPPLLEDASITLENNNIINNNISNVSEPVQTENVIKNEIENVNDAVDEDIVQNLTNELTDINKNNSSEVKDGFESKNIESCDKISDISNVVVQEQPSLCISMISKNFGLMDLSSNASDSETSTTNDEFLRRGPKLNSSTPISIPERSFSSDSINSEASIESNDSKSSLKLTENKFSNKNGTLERQQPPQVQNGNQTRVNPTGLQMLILWSNGITRKSSCAMSKMLKTNTQLEVLNVGHNNLSNTFIENVKDSLKDNSTLTNLGLQNTHLSCAGAEHLGEVIQSGGNGTLQRIDLRNNNLKVPGLLALNDALKTNKTITQVDLDNEPRRCLDEPSDPINDYSRILQDIRSQCNRNANPTSVETIKTPRISTRSFLNSRKISLTCHNSRIFDTTPQLIREDRNRLEPTRKQHRLKSPLPSPVTSPATSPMPSPSRNRFHVSRVNESGTSLTSTMSKSCSPLGFASSNSRFHVTIVEPSNKPNITMSSSLPSHLNKASIPTFTDDGLITHTITRNKKEYGKLNQSILPKPSVSPDQFIFDDPNESLPNISKTNFDSPDNEVKRYMGDSCSSISSTESFDRHDLLTSQSSVESSDISIPTIPLEYKNTKPPINLNDSIGSNSPNNCTDTEDMSISTSSTDRIQSKSPIGNSGCPASINRLLSIFENPTHLLKPKPATTHSSVEQLTTETVMATKRDLTTKIVIAPVVDTNKPMAHTKDIRPLTNPKIILHPNSSLDHIQNQVECIQVVSTSISSEIKQEMKENISPEHTITTATLQNIEPFRLGEGPSIEQTAPMPNEQNQTGEEQKVHFDVGDSDNGADEFDLTLNNDSGDNKTIELRDTNKPMSITDNSNLVLGAGLGHIARDSLSILMKNNTQKQEESNLESLSELDH